MSGIFLHHNSTSFIHDPRVYTIIVVVCIISIYLCFSEDYPVQLRNETIFVLGTFAAFLTILRSSDVRIIE
jgi:hypothetical protein